MIPRLVGTVRAPAERRVGYPVGVPAGEPPAHAASHLRVRNPPRAHWTHVLATVLRFYTPAGPRRLGLKEGQARGGGSSEYKRWLVATGAVSEVVANAVVVVGGGGDGGGLEKGGNMRVTVVEATSYATPVER